MGKAMIKTVFTTLDPNLSVFLKHRGYYLAASEQDGKIVFSFKAEAGLDQSAADYLSGTPFGETVLPGHFNRQPLTPLKSIRKRCIDCHGYEMSRVRNCPGADCHLHPFRMGREVRGKGSRLKAIRRYCVHDCMNHQTKEVRLCPTPECWLYSYRFGKRPIPVTHGNGGCDIASDSPDSQKTRFQLTISEEKPKTRPDVPTTV
jgi:hypothetical protein